MTKETRMTQPGTQLVDPSVRFISQLLDELQSGQLFIPRFQRGDVWDDEDRLDLLNSIETRIPIGSIMLWRTQLPMTTRRSIGGHILPLPPEQPPNTARDYILDGLQRLSTLLRALIPLDRTAATSFDEDDQPTNAIYYDLREQVFRVRGREPEELWHLPTTLLLHTLSLLAFQRKIAEKDPPDCATLIERADRIAQSFRTYKIPVVWVVTNELEDATQAFHRINSKGEKMGEAHMLNALTYKEGFDLEEHIERLRPLLASVSWGTLDPKFLLATVRALCGLDVTQPNAQALRKEIETRPELIELAGAALVRSAKFLKSSCGIPTPFWVPYIYQAVFLAYALRTLPSDEIPGPLASRLERWFWATAYTDYLRIGSRYKTQMSTLHALDAIVEGQMEQWDGSNGLKVDVLPKTLNLRTARAKIFCVRLAQLNPGQLGVPEKAFVGTTLLAEHGTDALNYILGPKESRADGWSAPENRIVYDPSLWKLHQISFRLWPAIANEDALHTHLMDGRCIELLNDRKYAEFLEERRSLMLTWESQFLRSLDLVPLP
jgi:hypothetical protein